MNKEFLPYEQALALKELGFDEPCIGWYVSEEYGLEIGAVIKSDLLRDAILAPLYQQAFRWFLEKYSMFAETTLWGDGIGYASSIKEIRQENFKEVYNLGSATPNRGLPNWDKNLEDLACLKRIIQMVEEKKDLDTTSWKVLVNPIEMDDLLLLVRSTLPDQNVDLPDGRYQETYNTKNGTYQIIWETDKERPIVRKFIE
jgi:hypothetical protein